MLVYRFNILGFFVSFRLLMLSSDRIPLILQDFVISMALVNFMNTKLYYLQFLNFMFLGALFYVGLNL